MLQDQVVVVTGAGGGLGRGIVRVLFEEGARVAVTDIDIDAAQATADLMGDGPGEALPLALDVTDPASIEGALEIVFEVWGGFDGWVNNAGVLRMDAALDVGPEDWDLHFDVNVKGLFLCCQAAARYLRHHGGAIVNIASNAGKAGYPNMVAYNASKAAVISITRSLAAEWSEHDINVNAVCPGGVHTSMLEGCAEWIGERTGETPADVLANMKPRLLDDFIDPDEVGRLVAFLLSSRARLIRGQAITADGGDTPY